MDVSTTPALNLSSLQSGEAAWNTTAGHDLALWPGYGGTGVLVGWAVFALSMALLLALIRSNRAPGSYSGGRGRAEHAAAAGWGEPCPPYDDGDGGHGLEGDCCQDRDSSPPPYVELAIDTKIPEKET